MVESFGENGRTCITSRVYPKLLSTDSKAHLYAFNYGSETVEIIKLKAWDMKNGNVLDESSV